MRFVALAFAALLLPTTRAHASGCYLASFSSSDPSINCEVVVHQAVHYSFPAPKLFVKRDNVMIEVTGTVDMRIENLPVEYPETDCDGNVISTRTVDEPYEVYRMTIEGGLVGDELFVDGFSAGHIQAAATSCVAPAPPQPVCGHVPLDCDYPYDDDEGEHEDDGGGGCSTGRGGAGLALAGLALVLARRRRG